MSTPNQTDELYQLEGKCSFRRVLPYSLQQILAMFVTNVTPITIITSAAVPFLPHETVLNLIQGAMVAAGIATFVQATPIWKIGSGLPIFMGLSFTFVIPLSAIAAAYGYPAVIGAVLAGGLFEALLAITAKYCRRAISPIVSAVVVTGIGLSLLSTAVRNFGGGYEADFGSVPNILIGAVTLLGCLFWQALASENKKSLSILFGLFAGYITAIFFGKINFSDFLSGGLFTMPSIMPFKPEFHLPAIISICIIYLISATETLGDGSAVTGSMLHRDLTADETTGILMADGLGSVVSGIFGGTPVTSYSENIGLTIMTRVVNRNAARVGGLILILAGFFPPVSRFMSSVPSPVIGGIMLMVLGQILVSGMEMIAKAGFTPRNRLIVALSLSIAIGFTASTEVGIWDSFPTSIQTIFSQNVVAVVFVTAMLLNLLLPKEV